MGRARAALTDEYVSAYIDWGEKQNHHNGSTCAGRVTGEREWYDLTGHERGAIFWPMAQQYKHAAPLNEHGLICNHNLFDVSPESVSDETLAGVLNSTWVVLSKFQYGRPVGVEGNLKTEVIDIKMMLVPNPSEASDRARARVATVFERLKERKALQFLSERRLRQMAYRERGKQEKLDECSDECELDMPDRRALDDAVLQMIGVRSKTRREEMMDYLYDYLREFFEWTRQKEEEAIRNKKKAKRGGRGTPAEIAQQIYDKVAAEEPRLLRTYQEHFFDKASLFDTYDLPAKGKAHACTMPPLVKFTDKKTAIGTVAGLSAIQNRLIELVANSGTRGLVRVPHDDAECQRVLDRYAKFLRERAERVQKLIHDRTADEDLQEDIRDALAGLLMSR